MFFYFFSSKRRKKNINIRDHLKEKYKDWYFLKKKWKDVFDAEILVIDKENMNNQKTFERFICLPNVKLLVLRNTTIKTLPLLPNCRKLITFNTCLQSLTSLPKCIYLDVGFNELREIKNLPNAKIIHCEHNKIHTIDKIIKCKKLYCTGNSIDTLPSLPNCVILECSNNYIKSLPYLTKCEKMILKQNPLESVIVNNNCKINFHGKKGLVIYRFSLFHDKIFSLLVKYNIWHKKNYGKEFDNKKLFEKLRYLSDNKTNLFFLHKILHEYFEEFQNAKIWNENDFDMMNKFLHWKFKV